MKDDQDTCSTGSSLSGIYKSIFKVGSQLIMMNACSFIHIN